MELGLRVYVVALLGVVLGAIGCGSGAQTTTTILVMHKPEAGFMGCYTDGPFEIPDGATMTYDIVDTGSNMEVGIANLLDGCDLTKVQAITDKTSWAGEFTKTTGSLSAGSYNLVFNCRDLSYFCQPTVYSLSYAN